MIMLCTSYFGVDTLSTQHKNQSDTREVLALVRFQWVSSGITCRVLKWCSAMWVDNCYSSQTVHAKSVLVRQKHYLIYKYIYDVRSSAVNLILYRTPQWRMLYSRVSMLFEKCVYTITYTWSPTAEDLPVAWSTEIMKMFKFFFEHSQGQGLQIFHSLFNLILR